MFCDVFRSSFGPDVQQTKCFSFEEKKRLSEASQKIVQRFLEDSCNIRLRLGLKTRHAPDSLLRTSLLLWPVLQLKSVNPDVFDMLQPQNV